MSRLLPTVVVVLAAVVAGLLFAPVFGVGALVLPLLAASVPVLVVAYLVRSSWVPWRPVIAAVAGLLAVTEVLLWRTTVFGVPTGSTFGALGRGVTESWLLTLRSTWPARGEPDLLLFVPLLVLAAAVIGVELLGRRPLLALLPSLAVLGVSQLFSAASGAAAIGLALAYAAVVVALLLVTSAQPLSRTLLFVLPVALVGVLAGVLVPVREPVSLRDHQSVPPPAAPLANPLNDVAHKLRHPSEKVFSYTASGPVDRWRLLALDEFDGVSWRTSGRERLLGDQLPAPGPAQSRTARIEDASGPWLPSQALPASVAGPQLLVDESAGSLRGSAQSYSLTWWEPEVDVAALHAAGVDREVPVGDVGAVPAEVSALARQAVGDRRPSAQTAMALDRFLSQHYKVATGTPPTGSGWPQLRRFLLEDKVGTSEQFAAAYVVMARTLGIPARLVVGYRAPAGTGTVVVHNRDVLVWPEVALEGIGWVPLDPTRKAGDVPSDGGLAQAAGEASQQLPEAADLPEPVLPPAVSADVDPGGFRLSWSVVVLLVGLVVGAWVVGVPGWQVARAAWRRRRGVAGAWAEVRDRLRAHGLVLTPGMTVRDAARAAGALDAAVAEGLGRLAVVVDDAVWSPQRAADVEGAWQAVREVRRGLARRGWRARVRAALTPR